MSKIHTGIIFDVDDEDQMDDLLRFCIEELDYDLCHDGKDVPGFLLLKAGKEEIAAASKSIKEFCTENDIELLNLMIFHADSIHHDSEIACGGDEDYDDEDEE